MGLPIYLVRLLVIFSLLFSSAGSPVHAQTSTAPLELIMLGSEGPGATGRSHLSPATEEMHDTVLTTS
jgi:hypothetical protein